MPVGLASLPCQFRRRLIFGSIVSEGDKRPSIQPEPSAILVELLEQLPKRFDIPAFHKTPGKNVTDALIVAWIQPQHIAIMTNRGVNVSKRVDRRS